MARKSILVVDDEKSQREILEMILTGEGYDVTTASSGEAAIKFAKDRRFDLALTDLKSLRKCHTSPEFGPILAYPVIGPLYSISFDLLPLICSAA